MTAGRIGKVYLVDAGRPELSLRLKGKRCLQSEM